MTVFTITETLTKTYDPDFSIGKFYDGEEKYFLRWVGKGQGHTRINNYYIPIEIASKLLADGMKFEGNS